MIETEGLTGAETLLRVLSHMGVDRIFSSPGSEGRSNFRRRDFYGRRAYFENRFVAGSHRGNGIQTIPLVTKALGSNHITTGITRFPVGAEVPMHSHNCDEQVTILEGEADVDIDGSAIGGCMRYDTTLVPANQPHRFVNVGTTPLAILWIYTSTEVTRTFAETGETVAHLSEYDQVSPLPSKGQ